MRRVEVTALAWVTAMDARPLRILCPARTASLGERARTSSGVVLMKRGHMHRHDIANHSRSKPPVSTRRSLMKGAAWSVPVLAASSVAPAYAASCPDGWNSMIGRGKALSGGLFNVDLDALAAVHGVIASAPTTIADSPGFEHGPQADGDPDEHHDPLNVTALSSITVSASGVSALLSDILSGLTPANVGAVNQYAYAASDGNAQGASGFVDDNGTIRTGGDGGYPELGTLDLKTLLTPLLTGSGATFLAENVANMGLEIGAVAGRARTEWSCQTEDVLLLERNYLLAHLRLVIESGLVESLVAVLQQAVVGINIAGIAGLKVDLAVLTNGPLPVGDSQPIQADLAAGTITVDIGALLGGDAYGANYSQWLNGREANTILFVDTPLPSAAISDFLGGLIAGLQDRLLDAVSVTILGRTGTLRALYDIPLVGTLLKTLVDTINGLFTSGTVKVALDAISGLLSTVFGWLENVINVRINSQNAPENNVPGVDYLRQGPQRWENSVESGRYDVAALGVSAVQSGAVLDLFLGRGSVGPTSQL